MGEGLRVCGYVRCGRAFDTPVRLTDFSRKPRLETYYACPYCFSKVNDDGIDGVNNEMRHLHVGGYEISVGDGVRKGLRGEKQKESDKAASTVNCPHHLGYLKTRSKDEAFPDGCLTCPRILQCMV